MSADVNADIKKAAWDKKRMNQNVPNDNAIAMETLASTIADLISFAYAAGFADATFPEVFPDMRKISNKEEMRKKVFLFLQTLNLS